MKKLTAIICLLVFMSLVLSGCLGKPPETITKEFLAALQSGDFEKTAAYVVNPDPNALKSSIVKDNKNEQLGKLMLSKASFEVGTATKTGDQAKVNVKVTAIDMVRVATKAMSELMPMAFAAAFSDTNKQDMDAITDQYLENSISDPQAPKVTTDVQVNLVKTKDGWKIASDNEQLLNAITGGASKAFNK